MTARDGNLSAGADLYARCLRGETSAWEEVHHRVLSICRWARWRIADRAEDVASSVLVSLLEGGLDALRDPAKLDPFLRRVTINRILDELRSRREIAAEDDWLEQESVETTRSAPSVVKKVIDREAAAKVIASIEALGDSCRRLLDAYLSYRVGLIESYRELESLLGSKAGVISVQVRRCLERLRRDPRVRRIGQERGWMSTP